MKSADRDALASLERELKRTEYLYSLTVGLQSRIEYGKKIKRLKSEMAKFTELKQAA